MTRDLYTNGTYSGPIVERTTKVVELGDAPAGVDLEAIAVRAFPEDGGRAGRCISALREYHDAVVAPLVAEQNEVRPIERNLLIERAEVETKLDAAKAENARLEAERDRLQDDLVIARCSLKDARWSESQAVDARNIIVAERDQWKSNAEVWQHVASESAAERWRRRFDDAVLKLGKRASEAEAERDRLRGELQTERDRRKSLTARYGQMIAMEGAAQADAARLRAAMMTIKEKLLVVVNRSPVHARDDHSQNCEICAVLKATDAALAGEPAADPVTPVEVADHLAQCREDAAAHPLPSVAANLDTAERQAAKVEDAPPALAEGWTVIRDSELAALRERVAELENACRIKDSSIERLRGTHRTWQLKEARWALHKRKLLDQLAGLDRQYTGASSLRAAQRHRAVEAETQLAAANAELNKLRAGQTWIAGPPTTDGAYWLVAGDGSPPCVRYVVLGGGAYWQWVRWHRPVVHPPIPDRSET